MPFFTFYRSPMLFTALLYLLLLSYTLICSSKPFVERGMCLPERSCYFVFYPTYHTFYCILIHVIALLYVLSTSRPASRRWAQPASRSRPQPDCSGIIVLALSQTFYCDLKLVYCSHKLSIARQQIHTPTPMYMMSIVFGNRIYRAEFSWLFHTILFNSTR